MSEPTRQATEQCPLCCARSSGAIFEIAARKFYECSNCDLLWASPACTLVPEEERARYLRHQNDVEDPKYQSHLRRIIIPLAPHLIPGMRALDFGCGPTTALATLLAERGVHAESYDPFFFPSLPACSGELELITCSEVAEHFHDPRKELSLMHSLLAPRGLLAVMTNLREGARRSPSWWYLRDSTHRCFYSRRTFTVICELFPWELLSIADDVVIVRRKG